MLLISALGLVFSRELFATLSLIIARIIKTRVFMGIDQVLTMPIFFASSDMLCR